MRVTLFGTRGSIPAPGPETTRYGGNTPAVEVRAKNGAMLAFDAGTGIRRLGAQVSQTTARIDILLTHLHMDHIQGLGFFGPLYDPAIEVHIWGPASSTLSVLTKPGYNETTATPCGLSSCAMSADILSVAALATP